MTKRIDVERADDGGPTASDLGVQFVLVDEVLQLVGDISLGEDRVHADRETAGFEGVFTDRGREITAGAGLFLGQRLATVLPVAGPGGDVEVFALFDWP